MEENMWLKKVYSLILVFSLFIITFTVFLSKITEAKGWALQISDPKDSKNSLDIKSIFARDDSSKLYFKVESWGDWDLEDKKGGFSLAISTDGLEKPSMKNIYMLMVMEIDGSYSGMVADMYFETFEPIDVDFKPGNKIGTFQVEKKIIKLTSTKFSMASMIIDTSSQKADPLDVAPDDFRFKVYKPGGAGSPAKLGVSSKTIDLGIFKIEDAKSGNFDITNEGEGSLTATLKSSSVLSLSETEVTIDDYGSKTIDVAINTKSLSPRTYSEIINISSSFGNESVTVNFEILPEPALKVDIDQIDFGICFRGERKVESIKVYNKVKGPIKVTLSTNDRWIVIGTAEFESNSQEIVISLNTKNIESKKYEGKIKVSSNGGNTTIPVLLEIIDSFLVDKAEIDFGEIDMDNPIIDPLSYSVKNNTDKDLTLKITQSDDWIGMTNTELKLDPNESRELKAKVDLSKMKTLNQYYNGTISIVSKYDKIDIKIKAYLKQTPPQLLWVRDPPKQEAVNEKIITGKMFEKLFTIKNDGSGILDVIVKLEDSKTDFRLFNAKFSLKKGETSDIKVKFDTTDIKLGSYKNTLLIETNGGNLKIPIQIEIVPKPEIIIRLVIGFQFAYINGEQIKLEESPYISSGTTMVPLRFIGEAFKAKVEWQNIGKGRIILTIPKKVIQLDIGNTTAFINGEKNILKAPPEIKGGRTFVPVRFISEGFGAKIEWKAETQQITIFYVLEE